MIYVFPAPAGINRMTAREKCRDSRVPRASGDKPCLKSLTRSAG